MTTLTPQEVEKVLGEQLWLVCPHCTSGQRVISWKNNPCLYLSCKKTFDVTLTDAEILKRVLANANKPTEPKKHWVKKEPKLQKLTDCYILVDQGGEWK